MTSAAFADDVPVGNLFEGAHDEQEKPRQGDLSAPATIAAASPAAASRRRLRLHDVTVISLLGGVQVSWIAALAYGLYWLVT
jgi:hypothetical protein